MIDPKPKASHFIDGVYVEDKLGAVIDVIYPATGQVIAQVHAATPQIIDAALAASKKAQPAWAALTGTERGRILRRAADMLRDQNRELSELETFDTGKPLQETLVADATSAADALEYFGGIAGSLTGEHVQFGDDFIYTIREPLGVCVGLGAWNYPTQIAAWKGAPALACGNSMVFKPSETTPLCALKVAEILHEAGLPAGLYNVVQGLGDVGASLVTDPRVDKVSLTGSLSTGRKVYAAAAEGMRHVTMELGGKSPLIIFDDANLEDAVSGAILANFYSSGQICSNGTRVFVQTGIKAAFLARLTARVGSAILGDPMDEATNFGPMISEQQCKTVEGFIAKGIAEGAKLICGGERLDKPGYWLTPAIFCDVQDEMTIAREEIFGPVISILEFKEEAEVLTRANATEYGLAAGVFTQNLPRAHRMVKSLEAGTCYINTYNDAPVEAPFGGVKMSGVGRENSKAAINHYSQLKSVYVRMSELEAPY